MTPREISLHDVYRAVGGDVFAMHASPPDHECHVGSAIQPVLIRAYERATSALCESLAQTTVADILRDTLAEAKTGNRFELQHA